MNYQAIEWAIKERRPFGHGQSMTGENDGKTYSIYSYSTLIYQEDLSNGNALLWNTDKYSQTTSRQQNIIKRALGL